MTEWNASEYAQRSGLQEAMAGEVLSLLDLNGAERVLDIGCGDGRIMAAIAARLPQGAVIGVDSSRDMIAFASRRFDSATHGNLRFEVADAHQLPFRDDFDLVVSF
jgi:trans-aconitate 2-methyltransferase